MISIAKKLFPTFNDPQLWRQPWQREFLNHSKWQTIRRRILKRDNDKCVYCGFECDRYMIVHHINDNPRDKQEQNLETICQMCNLILHIGQGVVIQGVVDLYQKSNHSQTEIIIITRKMRALSKTDEEIIEKLGLKQKAEFKQDKKYLQKLFGFVTSRKAKGEMTINGLAYQYKYFKEKHIDNLQKSHKNLSEYSKPIKENAQQQIVHSILRTVSTNLIGKHKLAAFLRGSKSQTIKSIEKKAGYGGLLWYDIPTILGFIEQLERMELLKQVKINTSQYSYPIVTLTDEGKKVLEKKTNITLLEQKVSKPIKLGESEEITLQMFKKGLKPHDIAKQRGLATSTIFGHIHRLVAVRKISAKQCVSDFTISKIIKAYESFRTEPRVKEVKQALSKEITYDEIRIVLADKTLCAKKK